jgi:uncharacterized protein YcaQ
MLLTPEDARRFLLAHHGLLRPLGSGRAAVRELLPRMRCIQLDPLDVIGTNADLCAMARVDGLARGEVYDALLPGHAFEHFAKERCLLPASAFPAYRDRAREIWWWRMTQRLERVDQGLINDVLAEVKERGPVLSKDLEDRGRVEPIDWAGWKSSSKASTMALEILWVRCQVVVCGRTPAGKRYDLPERALPEVATAKSPEDFSRWALLERVEAAGLLPRASGPAWGQLGEVRETLPDTLIAEGLLEEVQLPGTRRAWLAPRGFLDRPRGEPDDRMRILGPLDALLWDRTLIERAFGFKYVWEVYKPAEKRQYGWYVCPLLHAGRLVGRIEARVADGKLQVDRRWVEPDAVLDEDAYRACLERHASALGVDLRAQ